MTNRYKVRMDVDLSYEQVERMKNTGSPAVEFFKFFRESEMSVSDFIVLKNKLND